MLHFPEVDQAHSCSIVRSEGHRSRLLFLPQSADQPESPAFLRLLISGSTFIPPHALSNIVSNISSAPARRSLCSKTQYCTFFIVLRAAVKRQGRAGQCQPGAGGSSGRTASFLQTTFLNGTTKESRSCRSLLSQAGAFFF